MLLECLCLTACSSGAGATAKTSMRFVFLCSSLPMFLLSSWTTFAEFYLDTLIWRRCNVFWLKILKRKSQCAAEPRLRFHHSWPIIRFWGFFFWSATLATVCYFTPGILTAHFSLADIAVSRFMSFLTWSYQVLPFTLPFYPCLQMRFREAKTFLCLRSLLSE